MAFNQSTAVGFKRMSLPTFSAHWKDWPEFKAVWKSKAESANYDKTVLAHELKSSVREVAKHRIKSVYVTKPEAYDVMWGKLEDYYEDTSASVQAALEDLKRLKPVKEEDYKSLVELVDDIEAAYNQLKELNHLNTLTMRDVDAISDLMPTHLEIDWRRKYSDFSPADKPQPFIPFLKFLEKERSVVSCLAESQHTRKRGNEKREHSNRSHHIDGSTHSSHRGYFQRAFPNNRRESTNHATEQCKKSQMSDMVERQVPRKLSTQEIKDWNGPVNK